MRPHSSLFSQKQSYPLHHLQHKRRSVRRTSWTSTVAVRSLESDGRNKRTKQEKVQVYRAPMACCQELQSSHGWTLEYSTASAQITSKPSMWTMLLTGMKEIDTRPCSYRGIKTERILERCQDEMISNLQPDHLLWPDTWKVERISSSLEVNDFDSDHSTNSSDQTWNGAVYIID